MTALDQILLLEVSESYDMETWNTILETLVAAMLKTEKLANMDIKVRLAIAIAVVGSHRTEFFEAVFGILFEWEHKKGCWWIIQEELLRHFYIGKFYEAVQSLNSVCARKDAMISMAEKLDEMTAIITTITHPILLKRLGMLQIELEDLLKRLKFSSNMHAPLDKYVSEYPLQKFSKWFVAWAQDIISTRQQSASHPPARQTSSPSSVQTATQPLSPSPSSLALQKGLAASPPGPSSLSSSLLAPSSQLVSSHHLVEAGKTPQKPTATSEEGSKEDNEAGRRESLPKVNLEMDVMSLCDRDETFCAAQQVSKEMANNSTPLQPSLRKSDKNRKAHSLHEALHPPSSPKSFKSVKFKTPPTSQLSIPPPAKKMKLSATTSTSWYPAKWDSTDFGGKKKSSVCDLRTGVVTVTAVQESGSVCATSVQRMQTRQNSDLDLLSTLATTSSKPLLSVTSSNGNNAPSLPTTTATDSERGGRQVSSELVRLLVHKPIAVVKALGSEVWDTFSPGSQ